ncbi:MAG: inorganic pyrophosphatase Ppa [Desulfobacterales bacterium]|nr:MAG: inorganic pyrophosphatase Ppa [Desulfobacterales bacterium]
MQITKYPQEAASFQIQAYKRPKDLNTLRAAHVPFSGSPQKHPFDPDKVILVVDPYSTNTFYYEFDTEDISYVEELPNLVNLDGKTVMMVRVWIKKKSIAVRCTPFIVEDIGKAGQ